MSVALCCVGGGGADQKAHVQPAYISDAFRSQAPASHTASLALHHCLRCRTRWASIDATASRRAVRVGRDAYRRAGGCHQHHASNCCHREGDSITIAVIENLGTGVYDESTFDDHSSMSEETARMDKFTTPSCALALLA